MARVLLGVVLPGPGLLVVVAGEVSRRVLRAFDDGRARNYFLRRRRRALAFVASAFGGVGRASRGQQQCPREKRSNEPPAAPNQHVIPHHHRL